jgi:hypothetical protein
VETQAVADVQAAQYRIWRGRIESGWNHGEQSSLIRRIAYQGLFILMGLRRVSVLILNRYESDISKEVIDRMKRIVTFFKNIPDEMFISKREFLLTIAVSVLGGIVIGMIGSPRKTQIFGSYNVSGGGNAEEEA